ncbi:MAG: major capsid protein [Deltaproteobacteria bacterium]|nr:major capsid protein [Deltaproteobacteria bacterium]
MDAEEVDIDVIRGNEKSAALVPRGGVNHSLGSLQKALKEQAFEEQNRVYPLSIETYPISASQILKRIAGESIGSPLTAQERLRILAVKGTREMTLRSVRMFERLASQSARTGVQDAIIGTTDTGQQYDFRRNAANTFTPSIKWNDTTPTILANIETAGDKIRQNGHMRMNVCILGTGMMDAVVRDTEIQTLADNRRYELILISDKNPVPSELAYLVEAGFDARGAMTTPKGYKIWMFTYNEGYTNDSDVFVPYMPIDEVMCFDSRARCDRYFGPPVVLPERPQTRAFYQEAFGLSPVQVMGMDSIIGKPATVMPEMFHNDAYPNSNNTLIVARSQTAPIFANTMSDAFVRIYDGLV